MREFSIVTSDATGKITYTHDDPVKFVGFLRAMYGKRVTDAQYDPEKALYKGNTLTNVIMHSHTWPQIEGEIITNLIGPTGGNSYDGYMGRLGSAEIMALHEISEGGLGGAIEARLEETAFGQVYFEVRDTKKPHKDSLVYPYVCRACIGGFMQWSERGWAICAFQDIYDEHMDEKCSLCGLPLHKEG